MQKNIETDRFDFSLPQSSIAYHPQAKRDQSRLLYCNTEGAGKPSITHTYFSNLVNLLRAGDLLVLNNSFVIKARLHGRKSSGGLIEILVERILASNESLAIIKNRKSCKVGMEFMLVGGLQIAQSPQTEETQVKATIIGKQDGLWILRFSSPVLQVLDELGHTPLPPYIKRAAEAADLDNYQNVYADKERAGSVAAPTAGLHFTHELLESLTQKGIDHCFIALHVGYGTFKPVKTKQISEHKMHSEYYEISQETVDKISSTRAQGGRVIAVGTTSLRCLEANIQKTGKLHACTDETNIFIYPPYNFQLVDGLLTNFHTPKSTLLMLVCAFMQHKVNHKQVDAVDYVLSLYKEAIQKSYRFFSYGDANLIL